MLKFVRFFIGTAVDSSHYEQWLTDNPDVTIVWQSVVDGNDGPVLFVTYRDSEFTLKINLLEE